MYARIIEGRVQNTAETAEELIDGGCTHIVDVGDSEAQPGWAWTPEGCTPPPQPTEEDMQNAAAKAIEEKYAAKRSGLVDDYVCASLVDGASLEARLAALRTKWKGLADQESAEYEAQNL